MKKKLLEIAIFSVFAFVSTAQATMINAFDIITTFDVSQIGSVESYSLSLATDNPQLLLTTGINTYTSIPTSSASLALTGMLQRNYYVAPADRIGDTALGENWSMYSTGQLWGTVLLNGSIDFNGSHWTVSPIPDLSGFTINGLFAENFTTVQGSTAFFDTQILADVSPAPVPEPSSFILLAIGVAGIGFMRRRNMDKKCHSLS
ncbi:MAG: PEP-CTERM sorting domain-containing protein [Geobacteraceae bacterium]|nr:PEP-CTERM sorting domain-containing protein [Geobacteraceae bacterium]